MTLPRWFMIFIVTALVAMAFALGLVVWADMSADAFVAVSAAQFVLLWLMRFTRGAQVNAPQTRAEQPHVVDAQPANNLFKPLPRHTTYTYQPNREGYSRRA